MEEMMARGIQRLLGLMAATTAIIVFTKLKMRSLQLSFNWIFNLLRRSQWSCLTISTDIRHSLQWWVIRAHVEEGTFFLLPTAKAAVTTDASHWDWGTYMDSLTRGAMWELNLLKEHINFLELLAVKYAILSFFQILQGKGVSVRTDNSMVMAYINRQGSPVSWELCALALELWDLCITMVTSMWPRDPQCTSGLPQQGELPASWVGAQLDLPSLSVSPMGFPRNRCVPEIDAFAIRQNSKCRLFCISISPSCPLPSPHPHTMHTYPMSPLWKSLLVSTGSRKVVEPIHFKYILQIGWGKRLQLINLRNGSLSLAYLCGVLSSVPSYRSEVSSLCPSVEYL